MMAELGYAGQLELHEGKRTVDFANYGLKINVKFRLDTSVSDLDSENPAI